MIELIDYSTDSFCASSEITLGYRKMIEYYHRIPIEVAIFMEKVLLNLKYIVDHQVITPEDEADINDYFDRLKEIYLRHYKQNAKVRIRIHIKDKNTIRKIFHKDFKNVSELIDLKLFINGYTFDYKNILLQFKMMGK